MSRKKRLRLTPSWLPVIRDHMVAEGRQQAMMGNLVGSGDLSHLDELRSSMYGEMDALEAASLWWVNDEMCKVVESTLNSGVLPPHLDYPTVSGLLFFEQGFPMSPEDGIAISIDAIFWVKGAGDVRLRIYSRQRQFLDSLIDKSLPIVPMNVEKIFPAKAFLQTSLALMHEPSLSEVKPAVWREARDGARPRSMELQSSKVKVVSLRQPPKTAHAESISTRKPCEYRYIVNGFYRNQAYGPNHSLRRRQWIPPFVKGPAGAPLIQKKVVHSWTRL